MYYQVSYAVPDDALITILITTRKILVDVFSASRKSMHVGEFMLIGTAKKKIIFEQQLKINGVSNRLQTTCNGSVLGRTRTDKNLKAIH